MLLVLEISFKPLSIHSPGTDHYPGNIELGDRSYQLCSCSFSVGGDAEVNAFAETDIVPGVMKLGFEVDQIDVHLHGHLQTKAGLLMIEQPCFCYLEFLWFYLSISFVFCHIIGLFRCRDKKLLK